MRRVHVLAWGLVSAALMVLGSVGPWAKVLGIITVNGTDRGNDGWVMIGAALLGAFGLVLFWRTARAWLILTVLAAGTGLATTIYDRLDLEGTSEGIDVGQLVDPGWGIYVAMIGSAGLACASVAGLLAGGRSSAPTAPA